MKPVDCFEMYSDAEMYDLLANDFTDDIQMYKELAQSASGRILELACGTGRVTLPLAREGYHLSGLDVNDRMLHLARLKSQKENLTIDWIKADIRSFSLKERFGLIFIPINSICHLHELSDLEAMFKCVKEHLTDRGTFVVSMFVPDLAVLHRDPKKRYLVKKMLHPEKGSVILTESNIYEPVSQINRIKWYFEMESSREIIVENNMRIFFPQEFQALVKYNGFRIESIWGDYEMKSFKRGSPFQIYLLKKA